MHEIYSALKFLVAIDVESHFHLHALLHLGVVLLRDVHHHLHGILLLHGEDRELSGHVARVVVACSDNARDRADKLHILLHVLERAHGCVILRLELIDRLLSAAANVEQLHCAVIFALHVGDANFLLVDVHGIEHGNCLSGSNSATHINENRLDAVGRRSRDVVGLERLHSGCVAHDLRHIFLSHFLDGHQRKLLGGSGCLLLLSRARDEQCRSTSHAH